MVRRARYGAYVGLVLGALFVSLASSQCADPTQIVVDVRTDRELCTNITRTGIAVTSPSQVDSAPLSVFEESGCEGPGDRIGTLTITPSGKSDDEVAFRVVAAVNGKSVALCAPGNWDDCIVARRRVRFSPGKTSTVTVILAKACIGLYCGGELECDTRGKCVRPEDVLPDGGTVLDANVVDPPDGGQGSDAGDSGVTPYDGGVCANCSGTCVAATGKCTVNCGDLLGGGCVDKVVCGPGIKDCIINCPKKGSCQNTRCENAGGSCEFNCSAVLGDTSDRCKNIACSASSCSVKCPENITTCNGVYVDGGTNSVACSGTGVAPACDDVHCFGGTCVRDCDGGGPPNGSTCGPTSSCSGNCAGWDDGGLP